MFTLTFNTANAAFSEHFYDLQGEVARILAQVGAEIAKADYDLIDEPMRIRDVNGNMIGTALLTVPS